MQRLNFIDTKRCSRGIIPYLLEIIRLMTVDIIFRGTGSRGKGDGVPASHNCPNPTQRQHRAQNRLLGVDLQRNTRINNQIGQGWRVSDSILNNNQKRSAKRPQMNSAPKCVQQAQLLAARPKMGRYGARNAADPGRRSEPGGQGAGPRPEMAPGGPQEAKCHKSVKGHCLGQGAWFGP